MKSRAASDSSVKSSVKSNPGSSVAAVKSRAASDSLVKSKVVSSVPVVKSTSASAVAALKSRAASVSSRVGSAVSV